MYAGSQVEKLGGRTTGLFLHHTVSSVFEDESNTMSVDISIAVGAQASRIKDAFIYRALRLDRVTPSSGAAAGGTSVEIQGRGFPENPSFDQEDPRRLRVTFDGKECKQLERVSDTLLKCITPAGAGKPKFTYTHTVDTRDSMRRHHTSS